MIYKIKEVLSKLKKNLIVYLIIWVILNILLIMPVSYSYVNASVSGSFQLNIFVNEISKVITQPFKVIGDTFSATYFSNYIKLMIGATLIYIIFLVVAILKSKGNQYHNIEHGSSDWAQNGEQYKILSNKAGLILAEKNYLPLNKVGNVNVLIVGRFWFW